MDKPLRRGGSIDLPEGASEEQIDDALRSSEPPVPVPTPEPAEEK